MLCEEIVSQLSLILLLQSSGANLALYESTIGGKRGAKIFDIVKRAIAYKLGTSSVKAPLIGPTLKLPAPKLSLETTRAAIYIGADLSVRLAR